MAQNGVNNSLTEQELLFARLRYEGKLTNAKVAAKVGIGARTGDRWFKRPEIQDEIAALAEADTKEARLVLKRASLKAAKRLEALAHKNTRAAPLAETGRKAACDILQSCNISVKAKEQGNVNVFDFGSLAQMFEGIDTAAIRSLLDALRNGNRHKRASKVASGKSGPSNHKRSASRL